MYKMKKIIFFTTAILLFSGLSFADETYVTEAAVKWQNQVLTGWKTPAPMGNCSSVSRVMSEIIHRSRGIELSESEKLIYDSQGRLLHREYRDKTDSRSAYDFSYEYNRYGQISRILQVFDNDPVRILEFYYNKTGILADWDASCLQTLQCGTYIKEYQSKGTRMIDKFYGGGLLAERDTFDAGGNCVKRLYYHGENRLLRTEYYWYDKNGRMELLRSYDNNKLWLEKKFVFNNNGFLSALKRFVFSDYYNDQITTTWYSSDKYGNPVKAETRMEGNNLPIMIEEFTYGYRSELETASAPPPAPAAAEISVAQDSHRYAEHIHPDLTYYPSCPRCGSIQSKTAEQGESNSCLRCGCVWIE